LGHVEHPHNLWLGVFSETGLIGVVSQAGLVLLPTVAVLRSRQALSVKLHLVALLGLFLLLTFSDEFTLLISLHPVWLIGWTLLIFVWTWTRYGEGETATADFAVEPGDQKCR
jgi:O-antigen ligase